MHAEAVENPLRASEMRFSTIPGASTTASSIEVGAASAEEAEFSILCHVVRVSTSRFYALRRRPEFAPAQTDRHLRVWCTRGSEKHHR